MYIYNAKIFPVTSPVIDNGYVKIANGKIAEVNAGTPSGITDKDINAECLNLYPGFIDAHTHIGMFSLGNNNLNETSDPVTPHLRTLDGLNFNDEYFQSAMRAGITTIVTGFGSTNPIAGDLIAVKTYAPENALKQVGIKFALGENPVKAYCKTRQGVVALIRETLHKTRQYSERKKSGNNPDYDIKLEALIPLLERKIKAFFHCHRADDIFAAYNIAKEFELDYVLIHCTDGHLTDCDFLGENAANVIVGPIIATKDKPEHKNMTLSNVATLHEKGVRVAVCTDHPETPVEYLCTSVAYCIKAGLPYDEGLKAITINAAEIAGISDRTGSIEVGKDADLILTDGDPFEVKTNVKMTIIDGVVMSGNGDVSNSNCG